MKKIRKYQFAGSFPSLTSEFQTGASYINQVPNINTSLQQYIVNSGNNSNTQSSTNGNLLSSVGSSIIGKTTNQLSNNIFGDDSELSRNLASLFSSGLNSAGNTVMNNVIKKTSLTDNLSQNLGASLGGAAAGLGANYLGRGITSAMGNSKLGKFTGQATATSAGTIGSTLVSSGIEGLGGISPMGLAGSAIGAGLSAAFGPSKEYNGRYGSITRGMDTAYDALQAGVGLVPGGQIIAGAMALNKGLSNIFGSTSGMTKQDAILGSAFMPAPVKWLNMAGAKTTDTFKNQSWQNTEKTTGFMQNAFGNLSDKFDQAREEAGKTYGTFSRGARKRAQENIDFANRAWRQILDMTNQNEYQNIRAQDMTSINNQRYAQMIQGGFSPLARGKQGMKILNNSINHNLGQRFLSGAALIDNKQIILSRCREVD